MGEEPFAQIVDDCLPDPGHDVDPVVGAKPLDYRNAQIGQDGVAQRIVIASGQAAINGDFDEVRPGHRGSRSAEHQHGGQDQPAGIGTGECDQPPGVLWVDTLVVEFLGLGDIDGRGDYGHCWIVT